GRRRATALALSLAIAVLLVGCGKGCAEARETPEVAPSPTFPAPDLRLALVTDLMGQIEPCGCTSRPLGGLDLLAGVLREARGEAPTLAFAAGHLHFEGASIPEAALAQERFEAETTERALARAPFDAAFVAAPRSEAEEEFLARPARVKRLGDGAPQIYTAGGRRVLVVGVQHTEPPTLADALAAAPERDVTLVLHAGPRRQAAE